MTSAPPFDRPPHFETSWFRTFAETAPVAILVAVDGVVIYANQATVQLTGYSAEELLGRDIVSFAVPAQRTEAAERSARRLRGEPVPEGVEYCIETRSGDPRWVYVNANRIDYDERPALLYICLDDTRRRRTEHALRAEKERAQVTLASIGEGVVRSDADGRIEYLNPAAERLTGWSLAEAVGRPAREVLELVEDATGRRASDPIERCLELEREFELPASVLLVRRDGERFAIRDSVAPIRDPDGDVTGAVMVFKDVTELRGMERKVSFLARHDPLTGLLNRNEFENRLRRSIEGGTAGEAAACGLCYLDLDEFKVINDTCGHLAGDELIKQVAAVLRTTLRGGDALARLGGDEFGVLIEGATLEELVAMAERMREAINAWRFVWEDRVFEIGVSIGVVPFEACTRTGAREVSDLTQALSAADAACYVAKESGRNRIHVYQPDDTALALRAGEMQWVHRIHQALDQDRFVLYHQPIQAIGADAGERLAETFIRLRGDDGELIAPGSFIPAAERYHLITSIDRWVVGCALEVLARHARQGPLPYVFTINLSGQSLDDHSFLAFVVERLEASGVPPAAVCFEITETAAVGNLLRARNFMAVLRSFGCRFILDDFGSGLSSFSYLKNLPVDFLKIDGEFVRDVAADPMARAIIEGVVGIAQVMGLDTIGESVEDAEAAAALEQIGVDYAQGFWIGRPRPLEEAFGSP